MIVNFCNDLMIMTILYTTFLQSDIILWSLNKGAEYENTYIE